MRAEKHIVTLDEFQHNLLINGLNAFRNDLLQERKPTEDVDDLLHKLIQAPTRKEKRRDSGYDR